MKLKIVVPILLVLGIGWFLYQSRTDSNQPTPSPTAVFSATPTIRATPTPTATPKATVSTSKLILLTVPFTAQAPFGEWSDPRQQDGCEEASAVMAMAWVRGTTLNATTGKEQILAIADWESANYEGNYHDTSAEDTASRIFNEYFVYRKVRVEHDITADDIIAELSAGNLIVTPMNGQALGNPNFTSPGPERHMLVVIGYDPVKDQFITNDPGTRQGKGYRYDRDVFMSALRDYPTGYHVPIPPDQTAMIVVSK